MSTTEQWILVIVRFFSVCSPHLPVIRCVCLLLSSCAILVQLKYWWLWIDWLINEFIKYYIFHYHGYVWQLIVWIITVLYAWLFGFVKSSIQNTCIYLVVVPCVFSKWSLKWVIIHVSITLCTWIIQRQNNTSSKIHINYFLVLYIEQNRPGIETGTTNAIERKQNK